MQIVMFRSSGSPMSVETVASSYIRLEYSQDFLNHSLGLHPVAIQDHRPDVAVPAAAVPREEPSQVGAREVDLVHD